jgi:two-component system chemotaxis response regulator CheY
MRLFRSIEDNTNKIKNEEPAARQKHKHDFLVVDDSKFSRSILTDILRNEGYNIVGEAGDGFEAIELAKEKRPNFIFMDITMPNMDGLTAAKEIIKENPDVNIIMCSALSQKKIIVEAIKAGAKDFVIKPYKKENILNVVDLHMEADKKGQVIPFRSDNHLKKVKKDYEPSTAQIKDEENLSLDDMISKEIDIIFETYQNDEDRVELVDDPALEPVGQVTSEASLDIVQDKEEEAIALVEAEDQVETLNIGDTSLETTYLSDQTPISPILEADNLITTNAELETVDQVESLETLDIQVEDSIGEDKLMAGKTEETLDKFDKFLENFTLAADTPSLEVLDESLEASLEDEEEPTLAINDDATYTSFLLGDLADQDSTTDLIDTQAQGEDKVEASLVEAEPVLELTEPIVDLSEPVEAEIEIDNELLESKDNQEAELEILDADDSELPAIDLVEDTEAHKEIEQIQDTIVEELDSQDTVELTDISIEQAPANHEATLAQTAEATDNEVATSLVGKTQEVTARSKVNLRVNRIAASQLASNQEEMELELDFDFDTLYNLLGAYICIDNRFRSENMQFAIKGKVKSKKRLYTNSLKEDKESRSISLLNVYRKDIFKKQTKEEESDESLMIAITNLVRSKGTRILGNNRFTI